MPLTIDELNETNCKSYLLVVGGEAALVDPVRERLANYRRELARRGVTLRFVIETHTHADHRMLTHAELAAWDAPLVMHRASPLPVVDRHVDDGDVLTLGTEPIRVIHTPGHTPDSICLHVASTVLTGDTLLIGGSGRTDFPGGDAGAQFDAVTTRLFTLPDDTVVWPAHDYNGRKSSTIGDEKRSNPRFVGRPRAEYVALMANLGLPFPERVQECLQVNQSGFDASDVAFPTVSEVAAIASVRAEALAASLDSPQSPLVLDVREPEEFVGELGHIAGAVLVPVDALAQRLPKLAGYLGRDIVVVCRAGARSGTGAAILTRAGFRQVANLEGGMLAWTKCGLPIQR